MQNKNYNNTFLILTYFIFFNFIGSIIENVLANTSPYALKDFYEEESNDANVCSALPQMKVLSPFVPSPLFYAPYFAILLQQKTQPAQVLQYTSLAVNSLLLPYTCLPITPQEYIQNFFQDFPQCPILKSNLDFWSFSLNQPSRQWTWGYDLGTIEEVSFLRKTSFKWINPFIPRGFFHFFGTRVQDADHLDKPIEKVIFLTENLSPSKEKSPVKSKKNNKTLPIEPLSATHFIYSGLQEIQSSLTKIIPEVGKRIATNLPAKAIIHLFYLRFNLYDKTPLSWSPLFIKTLSDAIFKTALIEGAFWFDTYIFDTGFLSTPYYKSHRIDVLMTQHKAAQKNGEGIKNILGGNYSDGLLILILNQSYQMIKDFIKDNLFSKIEKNNDLYHNKEEVKDLNYFYFNLLYLLPYVK